MCFSVVEIAVLLEKYTVLNVFHFQCDRDSCVIGEKHFSECVQV